MEKPEFGMREFIKGSLISLLTFACTVDPPLPPPANPDSQFLSCTDASKCAQGQVCHLAIAGGTCAAPCTKDDTCAAMVPGLVCHPQASGGVCAPGCSVYGQQANAFCQSLQASLVCSNDRCIPSNTVAPGGVRIFNGLTDGTTIQFILDGESTPRVSTLTNGNLAPGNYSLITTPGLHIAHIQKSDGSTLIDTYLWSPAGTYQTLLIYTLDGIVQATFVPETITQPAPPGFVWAIYAVTANGLGALDLQYNPSASPQTLYGAVEQGNVREPQLVSTNAQNWQVAPAASNSGLTPGTVTLNQGQIYTFITWGGLGSPYTETLVLDPTGIVGRWGSTVIRLVNVSVDLGAMALSIDNVSALTTTTVATLPPAAAFTPFPPGMHQVTIASGNFQGNLIATINQNLAANTRYSFVVGGTAAQAQTKPPFVVVLADDDAHPGIRLVHAATGEQTQNATLHLANANTADQILVANVVYGSTSNTVNFDTSLASTLSVQFQDNAKVTTASQILNATDTYDAVSFGDQGQLSLWLLGRLGVVSLNSNH